jgi:hypothetical protein
MGRNELFLIRSKFIFLRNQKISKWNTLLVRGTQKVDKDEAGKPSKIWVPGMTTLSLASFQMLNFVNLKDGNGDDSCCPITMYQVIN